MATSQLNIPTQHITTLLGQYLEAPAKRSHHIATLLGATSLTSCVRLATLLWRVAACCELKIELVRMPRRNIVARTWQKDYNIMQNPQMLRQKFDHFHQNISANNTQHGATHRNTSQHGGQTSATCCDMLSWNVAIVWPGLKRVLFLVLELSNLGQFFIF